MNQSLLMTSILLIVMAVFIFLEYLIPHQKNWQTSLKQISQFPFFFAISFFLIPLLQSVTAKLSIFHNNFFSNLSLFPAIITSFLIAEFCYYWWHRSLHHNKFLWKMHTMHHNQPSVNFINFWFAHPLEIAGNYMVTNVPLILLGFKLDVIGTYLALATMVYMFSHLNANIKIGFLKYVIGNPQVHRFHHSTKLNEAKNFSNRLPLWDLVFNTFYFMPGNGPGKVGLINDETSIKSIASGLIFPFRKLFEKNPDSNTFP